MRQGTKATLTCDIAGLTVVSTDVKWKSGSKEYTQADNSDNAEYQVR